PCGFGIVQVICFFVLPDGTQEASATGLLGITAANGAFPAFGIHPSTCIFEFSEALLNEVRPVLFWMERVPSKTAWRITGAVPG
ncbi:MAG: hypothetical protein IK132_11880, partial [Clostridia bacterium]|nr:hypothetical protein [Clostridia bacterium]